MSLIESIKALSDLIALMVIIDKKADPKELQMLEAHFGLVFGEESFEHFMNFNAQLEGLSNEKEATKFLDERIEKLRFLPKAQQKDALKSLLAISLADQKLEKAEAGLLGYIAQKLGLSLMEIAEELERELKSFIKPI